MIDPTDKKTQPLALEQTKRGRGRPATGAAMTPAEKQKAYRERQKKEAVADIDGQIKLLSHLLEQAREDNQRLAGKVLELEKDNNGLINILDEANKEKKYWLERALQAEKSNVTEKEKPGKPKKGHWVVQMKNVNVPGARWKTLSKWEGWETEEGAKRSVEHLRKKFTKHEGKYDYRTHKVT